VAGKDSYILTKGHLSNKGDKQRKASHMLKKQQKRGGREIKKICENLNGAEGRIHRILWEKGG